MLYWWLRSSTIRLPRKAHDVKFAVTYWEHRKMGAVADEGDARAALLGYLEDATEYTDLAKLARARATLAKIKAGIVPSDLDIVAEALRVNNFDAPDGTEPDDVDETTDYAVTVIER
jgi:hypothetical protein